MYVIAASSIACAALGYSNIQFNWVYIIFIAVITLVAILRTCHRVIILESSIKVIYPFRKDKVNEFSLNKDEIKKIIVFGGGKYSTRGFKISIKNKQGDIHSVFCDCSNPDKVEEIVSFIESKDIEIKRI